MKELRMGKDGTKETVLLAFPTICITSSLAAMSWVDDILDKK